MSGRLFLFVIRLQDGPHQLRRRTTRGPVLLRTPYVSGDYWSHRYGVNAWHNASLLAFAKTPCGRMYVLAGYIL